MVEEKKENEMGTRRSEIRIPVRYEASFKSKLILAAIIVLVAVQLVLMLITKQMLDKAQVKTVPGKQTAVQPVGSLKKSSVSNLPIQTPHPNPKSEQKSDREGSLSFNFDAPAATPVLGVDLLLIKKKPNSAEENISIAFDDGARLGVNGKGMKVSYEFRSQSDAANWIAVEFNVSSVKINDKSELVLWVKGDAKTGYNPGVKVRLSDGVKSSEIELPALGQFWKRISVPLSEHKEKIDIHNINSFRLIIPISKESKLNKGTYHLDTIELS